MCTATLKRISISQRNCQVSTPEEILGGNKLHVFSCSLFGYLRTIHFQFVSHCKISSSWMIIKDLSGVLGKKPYFFKPHQYY